MPTRFTYKDQYDDAASFADKVATQIRSTGEDLTHQSFADSADLNKVLKRFGVSDGAIPLPKDPTFYNTPTMDYGEGLTLREVLDRQRAAVEHFQSLPAELKNRFRNDPAYLHDFVMDPKNTDEAVKLGLLKKAEKPKPPLPENVTPVT